MILWSLICIGFLLSQEATSSSETYCFNKTSALACRATVPAQYGCFWFYGNTNSNPSFGCHYTGIGSGGYCGFSWGTDVKNSQEGGDRCESTPDPTASPIDAIVNAASCYVDTAGNCLNLPVPAPTVNLGRDCSQPCLGTNYAANEPCPFCGSEGICCSLANPVGCVLFSTPSYSTTNLASYTCAYPVTSSPSKSPTKASCTDNIKNGYETDVDCGGNQCNPCANGKHCVGKNDCSSLTCVNAICTTTLAPSALPSASPTHHPTTLQPTSNPSTKHPSALPTASPTGCHDGVQDGHETDVDCGGSSCAKCSAGKQCQVNSDCASNHCGGAHFCLTSSPTPSPTRNPVPTSASPTFIPALSGRVVMASSDGVYHSDLYASAAFILYACQVLTQYMFLGTNACSSSLVTVATSPYVSASGRMLQTTTLLTPVLNIDYSFLSTPTNATALALLTYSPAAYNDELRFRLALGAQGAAYLLLSADPNVGSPGASTVSQNTVTVWALWVGVGIAAFCVIMVVVALILYRNRQITRARFHTKEREEQRARRMKTYRDEQALTQMRSGDRQMVPRNHDYNDADDFPNNYNNNNNNNNSNRKLSRKSSRVSLERGNQADYISEHRPDGVFTVRSTPSAQQRRSLAPNPDYSGQSSNRNSQYSQRRGEREDSDSDPIPPQRLSQGRNNNSLVANPIFQQESSSRNMNNNNNNNGGPQRGHTRTRSNTRLPQMYDPDPSAGPMEEQHRRGPSMSDWI